MKRVMNKSGQYYLVAAIIIAALIIGIVTVSNYSKKGSNVQIEDLKDELQIEGAAVLDHATYNLISHDFTRQRLEELTQEYIDQKKADMDFYFLFGTSTALVVKGYQSSAKTILAGSTLVTEDAGEFTQTVPSSSEVTLYIDEDSYDFELNQGENFYFVLSQEIKGGEYIVSG